MGHPKQSSSPAPSRRQRTSLVESLRSRFVLVAQFANIPASYNDWFELDANQQPQGDQSAFVLTRAHNPNTLVPYNDVHRLPRQDWGFMVVADFRAQTAEIANLQAENARLRQERDDLSRQLCGAGVYQAEQQPNQNGNIPNGGGA